MGRSSCCSDDANVKKGPWTPEEDQKLIDYINEHAPIPQNIQTPSDFQGAANSWESFEGEFKYETPEMSDDKCLSSSCDSQTENSFSELVTDCPETYFMMNQMENKIKISSNQCNSPISADTSIFQAWEKLLDDENGSSCWKDILDLTSSPLFPMEW
ncbi:hypothetical protein COLO4_16978 [Corchorus olitorius]|uniref:Uncharacterized protein n=1 Tax=Corchorus olitorius TaxID=93759 RepID=A0A1R3JEU6_9ROSI|nr:hypothetical protein COLO4_16978 [Corchorus olitorius]